MREVASSHGNLGRMLPGPYVPAKLPAPAVEAPIRQQAKLDETLTVEYMEAAFDSAANVWTFSGGVKAKYGPTVLTAPRLVIDMTNGKGTSEGGVEVTDPEGSLHCEVFEFRWREKTGHATGATIQIDQNRFLAREVSVEPGLWELQDVRAAFTRTGESNVWLQASSVTIRPGIDGVARHVYLEALGKKIGPIPRVAFQLRKRIKGLGLPSITNRRGVGVGVTWDAGIPLGDHGVANVFWETFPRQSPGYGLGLAFSPLDPGTPNPISPTSDLGERFSEGWFDSVTVARPEDEERDLRNPRLSYGVGSFWNRGTVARSPDATDVSKRIDLVYEIGGNAGGFGYVARTALQSVRPDSATPFRERALVGGTLSLPPLSFGDDLAVRSRVDLFGTGSRFGAFGFARAEAGLVYCPNRDFAMGAAYVAGGEAGRADFGYDRLGSKSAVHLRADYSRGPYTFRYLAKYDTATRLWYDREFELAIVAGPFEPFLQVRQFPSETRLGVRFRIDGLRDRIQQRKQDR